MRTRLLRKLRKRYRWYYDHEDRRWVLLDQKNKRVRRRKELHLIVEWMIVDIMGFYSTCRYLERALKRKNAAEFKSQMAKIEQ